MDFASREENAPCKYHDNGVGSAQLYRNGPGTGQLEIHAQRWTSKGWVSLDKPLW